ncbi:MAG: diacylglycerol kinase catalytic region [Actinotalea sp.]|nr:diacylglycerol kinase catalytic region [Actinotalea sp.]
MTLRLGVVVNPTSGHGRGAGHGGDVLAALRRRGHVVQDLSASDVTSARQLADQAVTDGLDALVVVGGDGMVHLGVNVVAGTGLPLGVVAAGSGNDVARALGLPQHDVDAAVRTLERGLERGPRAVDAVAAAPPTGGRAEWFLGVLSCGIDAAANARANEMSWPPGAGRYVRALASVLASFRPYGYRITTDHGVWESAGTLVAVANTPWFGGGIKIAPDAVVDDGLLDVVVAGPFSRAGVIRIFPGMYRGRHVVHPAVQVLRTRSVLIEHSEIGPVPPVAFSDGERLGPLPLRVAVRPGAVLLLG